jgi:hypothetical protein
MNYRVGFIVLFITPIIFSQNSNITIDSNSTLTLDKNNTICSDEFVVNNGSTLWAYDYGLIKTSDCSSVLTPTGNGLILLPVKEDDAEGFPNEFSIESAYPNPFNPFTTIKYGIPERSLVTISIYDIKGNLLSTSINDVQEPGWYDYTWYGLIEGGEVAATGVYILKINTLVGGYHTSKSIKISLIK